MLIAFASLRTASRRASKRVSAIKKVKPTIKASNPRSDCSSAAMFAARTVTLGPCAQSPSKFARQKDSGDANKKKDKKEIVVQVSHNAASAANDEFA